MIFNLAARVAASLLCVPPETISQVFPMMEPIPSSFQEFKQRQSVNQVLDTYWKPSDGFVTSHEEELMIDQQNQCQFTSNTEVLVRPSIYGEITRLGARQLFSLMKLKALKTNLCENVFYDLGSGAGRLTVQAYLEIPSIRRAVGVELAPTRHSVAIEAWNALTQSGAVNDLRSNLAFNTNEKISDGHEVYFYNKDLFQVDLTDATHIYISSLCFSQDMMVQLSKILTPEKTPNLQCIATLKTFPYNCLIFDSLDRPSISEFLEMTWTRKDGDGCLVHFYYNPRFRNNKK